MKWCYLVFLMVGILPFSVFANAQEKSTQYVPYSPKSYPDEVGYQKRLAGMLQRFAQKEVGKRCLAVSNCPDTGLVVRTMAVEGEVIYSPYTGRAYLQGNTGVLGPKKRDSEGRISAFGGQPLRDDLPPALARLLQDPQDKEMQAWLSVPGNLNQQYPLASVSWARFWPLLSEKMPEDWRFSFKEAVGKYIPGVKETESETPKILGSTSRLLYGQLLGRDTRVFGATSTQAELATTTMLTGFLRTVLTIGNSDYDSPAGYASLVSGYCNLFDFSPKPPTKALAQAMLDYYTAGYGLKMFNGVHAGATTGSTKQGWPGDGDRLTSEEMDAHLWLWSGEGTIPIRPTTLLTSVQQATTTYRPNRIIHNILIKNVPLPFEAQIAHPNFSGKEKNTDQETFYCTPTYALGSVATTQNDAPNNTLNDANKEQTIWSLVSKTTDRSLVFGGGQPQFRHPRGHSLFDQVIQKRGALLVMTGIANKNVRTGLDSVAEPLTPAEEETFWLNAPHSAATWLFVPRTAGTVQQKNAYFFDAGMSFVVVRPFGGTQPFWYDPNIIKWIHPELYEKEAALLQKYRILVIPTGASGFGGFVLDATSRADYPDLFAFAESALTHTVLDSSKLPILSYQSLLGDKIRMQYRLDALRAEANINGQKVDWLNWANGGVYASPYLTIKEGKMTLSDGAESYSITLDKQNFPVWR